MSFCFGLVALLLSLSLFPDVFSRHNAGPRSEQGKNRVLVYNAEAQAAVPPTSGR